MAISPTRKPGERPVGRRRKSGAAAYEFLTVGETARILGVSASTLRLWENVGLVSPVRSNGRYRLYSPDLLKVLKRIKYLRDVQRLNVPGIKRAMGTTPAPRQPAGQPMLGPVLRRLRKRRRMGLVAAATQAGISAGFLSSVERSQAKASVATLKRLAAAYETTVTELFTGPTVPGRLVKQDERRSVDVHPGVRAEVLSAGSPLLQSSLIYVSPLAGSEGSYSHQGEEFIYVLSGSLEMWLDEAQCYVLHTGDSFSFESTHGHRWFNPGDTETALLWINTPPF